MYNSGKSSGSANNKQEKKSSFMTMINSSADKLQVFDNGKYFTTFF